MKIEKSSETRKLSLHPLAIHTFIKAQAGSLGKALSEAVMNSLDAFAGTINVTLTGAGFSISDDGQGFQSRDEIEAWFETLGFPHDDGNHRVFGKFGMGRAQMWAFAKTSWQSNDFTMNVDVQRNGLDYDLICGNDSFKGTRINATFYEPLAFQDQERVRDEFFALVKFVPGLVTFNGKVANKNPADETWDIETPQAWMKFDTNLPTLTVYNSGLLVSNFPRYRFNCAGIVVTKPEATLSLNMARNEILETDCLVWKNLVKQFPKKTADYARIKEKPTRVTERDKATLIREVKAGVITLQAAMLQAPLLVTSVIGRAVPYSKIARPWSPSPSLFLEKGDDLGKRIHRLKLANVYDKKVLEIFDTTVDEFKELILQSLAAEGLVRCSHYAENLRASLWSTDGDAMFPDIAGGKTQFTLNELDEEGRATLSAWTKCSFRLRNMINSVREGTYIALSVSLGDSPKVSSWWDGATNTFVLRKKEACEAMQKSMPQLSKYVLSRLLDLCKGLTESENEASEMFVKLITETPAAGELVLNLSRFYAREAADRELLIPKTRLAELDALGVE